MSKRPVNSLTQLIRLVQVVKQWFMSHTIIGELHRYLHTDDKQFCQIFFVLKASEPGSPCNDMQSACKESPVIQPGSSGFCDRASEFCAYLARRASED